MVVKNDMPPRDIRYDPSDSQPTYIGIVFDTHDANTGTTVWRVFKFTYTGTAATRIQRRDNIEWDERAAGF